ncbi:Tripartite motif-containing 29 [Melia azedarach]|uniref:Tripartite motif-containing 29 n=1 Tax=Melia azedarach TaxID=155640 RepID=A0ACC1XZR9_MELAZ|nr:Tripartite motif-containing 29 [Melia azedarach]
MENGHGGNLSDKFLGLVLNDKGNASNNNNNNDSLFQVMKAVEAAEATIKHQVEESNRLKTELLIKSQELEKYKLEESIGRKPHCDPWKEHLRGNYEVHQSVPAVNNLEDRIRIMGNTSAVDPSSTMVLRQDLKPNVEDAALQSRSDIQSESSKNNGTLKVLSGGQAHADVSGPSQLSSPSTTSFSPTRYQIDGEYDPRFNLSGQGLMPMAEVNNPSSLWKQDLVLKIREHEEEIMQLRKHLSEYSIKEAQIRNEKYVLEKRIAYMRLAFDQQQQDLVDAASKALSYRQDIIEENIHLTYQLQAAQQERTTFVQSLLPLLAEYSLQPPVPDAQSIVSNVKVLFKHLQEKLILTESKLKESQYQLAPWRSDLNQSNIAPQASSHSTSAALINSNKNGLELVAQPTFSHGEIPTNSDAQGATDWDLLGHHQDGLGGVGKNLDDDMRYSPLASRDSAMQAIPAQLAGNHDDPHATRYGEETANKQVKFRVPVSNSEMDDPDAEEQSERDHSSNWPAGHTAYTSTLDDPNSSYSPYLAPVLEEPSSSFSEGADDDPLPAIEGLQISGEAFPGRQLQACGYSINGTTSCNFEWVRHLEDGSVNYIDGAKQPNYLVTADDVDTYLAIEVQPLDDRKRKGELVKVFANEHRKITCDHEMQNYIEKTFYSGHASYRVSVSTGYLDIWEPATLAIKREGYSIKCTGPSGLLVTEKFSPTTTVTIPYGNATEFLIIGSSGTEHLLRADSSTTDVSCTRDTIVLTLRLFIIRASEKRKGRKRGLFFHK